MARPGKGQIPLHHLPVTFLVDGPVPVVQVIPSIPVESLCP